MEPCGDASSQGHLQVLSHLYTSALMRSSIDQHVCVNTHTHAGAHKTHRYELTSSSTDTGLSVMHAYLEAIKHMLYTCKRGYQDREIL